MIKQEHKDIIKQIKSDWGVNSLEDAIAKALQELEGEVRKATIDECSKVASRSDSISKDIRALGEQ